MMIKLVSIITPNLNGNKYYNKFINSIKNQSYKKWELIIIDDFSNERSYSILKDLIVDDKRIKLYRNEKNMGVSYSRNLALKYAKGEFISFCDIDDVWEKKKLEKQMNLMNSENLFFSCTEFHKVDGNGNFFQNVVHRNKLSLENVMKFKFNIACSSVLFRKNKFRFDERLSNAEDYLMWIKILKYAKKNKLKIDYLRGKNLLSYLDNPGSLSSNKFKQVLGVFTANKFFFNGNVFFSLYYLTFYLMNSIKRIL